MDSPTFLEASLWGGTEETFRAGDRHGLGIVGPWGRSNGK